MYTFIVYSIQKVIWSTDDWGNNVLDIKFINWLFIGFFLYLAESNIYHKATCEALQQHIYMLEDDRMYLPYSLLVTNIVQNLYKKQIYSWYFAVCVYFLWFRLT